MDCIELDPHSGYFPNALKAVAKLQRIPLTAQFELTARCNFNCRMCYIHMTDDHIRELGRELTTEEWLRIARELKEMGTLYLSLTGGEIFMRSDFRTLYEELSKMGFLIQLMTNISMINEDVMSWLIKNPPYNVSTTLYGSTNEIYQSVCRISHGFDRFDHALTLLQTANIPVSIKAIVIKNNEADVENMFNYAAEHGILLRASYAVNKPVRGAVSEAASVRRMRYELDYTALRDRVRKPLPGHGPFIHHQKYLDDCGAYENSVNITWDGHMVLCSFMAEPFVDVCKVSIKEAWPLLLEKLESVHRPEKCTRCKYEEYCVRCPGSLAAECGLYDTVTNSYCKTAKFLYDFYKKENMT